jgi:hypothetical protein
MIGGLKKNMTGAIQGKALDKKLEMRKVITCSR